ncbi:hypothetical protein ACGFW5_32530 [Streptomyces sp. NPDC048416]|uniref:hypothetical protein n=1 Tax=Streptomyces sp. NPDC048416 TaxID=3365546 RepID=UPI003721A9E3
MLRARGARGADPPRMRRQRMLYVIGNNVVVALSHALFPQRIEEAGGRPTVLGRLLGPAPDRGSSERTGEDRTLTRR